MTSERLSGTSSSEHSTWIILAVLLIVGALVALGIMTLIPAMQHAETPTGSQSVPTH